MTDAWAAILPLSIGRQYITFWKTGAMNNRKSTVESLLHKQKSTVYYLFVFVFFFSVVSSFEVLYM